VHQVTARVKSRSSLERKLSEKPNKYKQLTDITDISGFRVIVYFEDDVDRVAEVIEREFQVDLENTVDKRKRDGDQFGYQSLQYIVSHSVSRAALTEFKPTAGIRFEIQIRSVMQHGWAEIEHGLGYHGTSSLPGTLRRRFARVAALLEVADSEFVDLRNEIQRTRETMHRELSAHTSSLVELPIDQLSLEAYAQQSPVVHELDVEVAGAAGSVIDSNRYADFDIIARGYSALGLKSITALEQTLRQHRVEVVRFTKAHFSNPEVASRKTATMPAGVSLGYLCYYLIAATADATEQRKAIEQMFEPIDPSFLDREGQLQELLAATRAMS
jgi:ppGpp synthetase/RelA/SpoT-type nucleotidyltranferase